MSINLKLICFRRLLLFNIVGLLLKSIGITIGYNPTRSLSCLKEEIPPLFKNPGIQDITDQYVVCEDIEVPLWNEKHPKEYVYLCCYDIIGWNPVCWGRPEGSKVRFPKMGVNMLYLPAYYNDGEIRPAGDAFILTREGKLRKLLPDFEKSGKFCYILFKSSI